MLNFENCYHVNFFRVRARINMGQFPKRVPKVQVSGHRGVQWWGMLPQEFFFDLNSIKLPLLGF